MRVLAIDPSLRGTGFAILETAGRKVHAVTYGTIRNRADLLPSGCLVNIHERICDLIREYAPECAAVEGVIFVQSHRIAITLGAARGAALGILVWIGFVGPITYTTYMYEVRPKELFAINEFYSLVGLCLMGAILGAWTKKAA